MHQPQTIVVGVRQRSPGYICVKVLADSVEKIGPPEPTSVYQPSDGMIHPVPEPHRLDAVVKQLGRGARRKTARSKALA